MAHLKNTATAIVTSNPNGIASLQSGNIRLANDGVDTWDFIISNSTGSKWVKQSSLTKYDIKSNTGSRNLLASDRDTYQENSGNTVITIVRDSISGIEKGDSGVFCRNGSGTLEFAEAGSTIRGNKKLREDGSAVTWIALGNDTYRLIGDTIV